MKKIYLQDLEKEELKKIIINNSEFLSRYGEALYQDYMDMQLEEGNLMFGDKHYKYIDIRDNYDSFYLKLINWHDFIDNLCKDYLCQEGIDLYDYIIKKRDVLYNMEQYNDSYYDLEGHIEQKCNELLKICENQLHEYENYPDDEDIFDFIYDNEYYDGYYTDENKKTIYEDIAYTKRYD